MLGKKFSDEHRRRMSISATLRATSPEFLEMVAETGRRNKGRKRSKETKEKLRLLHLGSKRSDETKAKMSLARKLWWDSRKVKDKGK